MALRFSPPPFDERRQAPDLSASFDAFMNAYARSKQLGMAEQQAKNQQTTFNQGQDEYRRGQEERDMYERSLLQGRTMREVSPTEQRQAFGYQPMGQYNPATETGAVPQQGQGMLSPQENDRLSQIGMGLRALVSGRTLPIQEKLSEIDLNRAKADAARRGQVFVDPSTGEQIIAPTGAKLIPRLSNESATGAKQLPANTVLALNEGKNVARLLPEVEQAIMQNVNIFGPVKGRAGGVNPYDKQAQTVDARMRTASQAFGRFMEGGVLRKEDEEKYRKMFPQLKDTPDLAQNKLAMVRRQIAQKYEDDKNTLGNSGYDVSGFGSLDVPRSLFGSSKIKVSNGSEILEIDPNDENDALKDGYRRLE